MDKRRVVVTGVGALTPIGNTAPDTWKNALNGVNGIGKITRIDNSDYNIHDAGELKDFNVEDYMATQEARRMYRFPQHAIVAAGEAVADTGLETNDHYAERIGVWAGSGLGGIQAREDAFKALYERGPRRVSPFL